MMDPYQVLGVSRNASDDEIKKAYRNLSRRYHPDANVNNPNKDQAEEKFKQIQQAYDQIMKEKQQGTSDYGGAYGNGYGGSYYGGFGSGYGGGYYGGARSSYQEESSRLRLMVCRHCLQCQDISQLHEDQLLPETTHQIPLKVL